MGRIAVAATSPFGADVLERLASRHEVVAVLTRPDAPRGRGRKLGPPPAKVVAQGLAIPVLQPERLTPELDLGADRVVICAFGVLIPKDVLAGGRLWLNVHPSLLPRWRGAAPVERALLAGDTSTGVTIHETVEALDAGPIAASEAFAIDADDDAGAVYARAAEVAARLLEPLLDAEDITFEPQAAEGVTYAEKIGAPDRRLDLSRPADELVRRVRALSPHIGARTDLDGRPVTVWRAKVDADGTFRPLEVQPDGGKRMTVEAWRRGLR